MAGIAREKPNKRRYEMNLPVSKTTKASDLFVPTLEAAFDAGGVHLGEVPVDYSKNQKVLIDDLAEKVCLI